MQGATDEELVAPAAKLAEPLGGEALALPARRADVDATVYSAVLGAGKRPTCHPNAPLEFQDATVPHRGASQDARAVRGRSLPSPLPAETPHAAISSRLLLP
jgi:hypothetical protein